MIQFVAEFAEGLVMSLSALVLLTLSAIYGIQLSAAKEPSYSDAHDAASTFLNSLMKSSNKKAFSIPIPDTDHTVATEDGASVTIRLTKLDEVTWNWQRLPKSTLGEYFTRCLINGDESKIECYVKLKAMAHGVKSVTGAKDETENCQAVNFKKSDLDVGEDMIVRVTLGSIEPTVECEQDAYKKPKKVYYNVASATWPIIFRKVYIYGCATIKGPLKEKIQALYTK